MSKVVTVIIPCYNEEATIEELLIRVEQADFGAWKKEVLVVDDGSTDSSRRILDGYRNKPGYTVIFHEKNGGKGEAERTAIKHAKGDYLVLQDADLEYNPAEIKKMLDVVDDTGAQVVFGSRNFHTAWHRVREHFGVSVGVWVSTWFVNILYGTRLTDAWTCYKLFSREVAQRAHFIGRGFEADYLFIGEVAVNGYEIVEVPISHTPRSVEEGKKIRYKDGIRSMALLLKHRLSHVQVLPFLLLTTLGLFVFAPVLFFGKAFSGEEQIGLYYALSHYEALQLERGESLLWNSGYYGGAPSGMNQFVSLWYPINTLLLSTVGFFLAHHLSILIGVLAGLFLAYYFGRVQGWGVAPSLVLALGYLSATTFGWLQIGTNSAYSFAALPALLIAVHSASRTGRYWLALVGGALSLSIGFIAGFAQIMFYNLVLVGCYALFLDYLALPVRRSWFSTLRTSIALGVMVIVGVFIALIQLLPPAALIDLTIRSSTFAAQNANYPSVAELVVFFLPPYFTLPFVSVGGTAGLYVGALGIALAGIALWYYRSREVFFFAGTYLLTAAFAFHLPLFSWLNEHIPPFSHMSGNLRWLTVGALPLAFLAAAGLEGLLREPERIGKRGRFFVLLIIGSITTVLVAGSLALQVLARVLLSSRENLWSLVQWYTGGRELAYSSDHYIGVLTEAIDRTAILFSLGNPKFLFGVLCWVAATLFFVLFFYTKIARRFLPHVAIAVLFVTVAGVFALQWDRLVPQSLYEQEPRLVSILKEREVDKHSYRIMGYLVGDGFFLQGLASTSPSYKQSAEFQREVLTNNTNLHYGIERMDGMELFRTLRANRLLNTVIAYDTAAYAFDDESPLIADLPLDRLYNREVQMSVSPNEKLTDLEGRMPLLSMMNVKYLYSPYRLPAPSLRHIATVPLDIIPGTAASLYVYENPVVVPRIYVARHAVFVGTERAALQRVIRTRDFSEETVIECSDCASDTGDATALVTRYQDGDVEVKTRSDSPGWLVLSESLVPGWVARIDGREAPLYPANYLFQAVYVPAGEHRVSFTYEYGALF